MSRNLRQFVKARIWLLTEYENLKLDFPGQSYPALCAAAATWEKEPEWAVYHALSRMELYYDPDQED